MKKILTLLRHTLLGVGLTSVAVTQTLAMSKEAEEYPKQAIRIVIGYTAGGSTDMPFRILAENLSEILKTPVIVENKPGAGGILPALQARNSKADGYTLVQTPTTIFRLPYINNTDWDPVTGLDYVINLAGYSFGLVVPADSPIKTMQEYIDYAKQHPNGLTYGTPGAMTSLHITMEQIARETGTQLVHVPYKGNSESMQAVLAGFVMSVADTPAWAQYVENGKLRLLSTWGEQRS